MNGAALERDYSHFNAPEPWDGMGFSCDGILNASSFKFARHGLDACGRCTRKEEGQSNFGET
jgi:hypothetical protein